MASATFSDHSPARRVPRDGRGASSRKCVETVNFVNFTPVHGAAG